MLTRGELMRGELMRFDNQRTAPMDTTKLVAVLSDAPVNVENGAMNGPSRSSLHRLWLRRHVIVGVIVVHVHCCVSLHF